MPRKHHVRTTRPHAGRAVIDIMGWPGYSLLVVGMMAFFGCLTAFATGHDRQGIEVAVFAVVAATLGVVWLVFEHRRIGRVDRAWQAAHRDVQGVSTTG